jgi:hypothetical protein
VRQDCRLPCPASQVAPSFPLHIPTPQGRLYRELAAGRAGDGGVALVLGAGNQLPVVALDVLHKLVVDGEAVLCKLNPVNEYLGPFLGWVPGWAGVCVCVGGGGGSLQCEWLQQLPHRLLEPSPGGPPNPLLLAAPGRTHRRAFQPLIDAGLLRLAYGGGDVGRYLCGHAAITSGAGRPPLQLPCSALVPPHPTPRAAVLPPLPCRRCACPGQAWPRLRPALLFCRPTHHRRSAPDRQRRHVRRHCVAGAPQAGGAPPAQARGRGAGVSARTAWGRPAAAVALPTRGHDPVLPCTLPSPQSSCVTPYLVVPGPWSEADLQYHADSVAAGLTNNAGKAGGCGIQRAPRLRLRRPLVHASARCTPRAPLPQATTASRPSWWCVTGAGPCASASWRPCAPSCPACPTGWPTTQAATRSTRHSGPGSRMSRLWGPAAPTRMAPRWARAARAPRSGPAPGCSRRGCRRTRRPRRMRTGAGASRWACVGSPGGGV